MTKYHKFLAKELHRKRKQEEIKYKRPRKKGGRRNRNEDKYPEDYSEDDV